MLTGYSDKEGYLYLGYVIVFCLMLLLNKLMK